MKCPKCLSKHVITWNVSGLTKPRHQCQKCKYAWYEGEKNVMQKASGVKPEDLPDIVVAQPMITYPIKSNHSYTKPKFANTAWYCIACGAYELEPVVEQDAYKCLDCKAVMTFELLANFFDSVEEGKQPLYTNAKFWRDDFVTDQTSFKFTIETRIVPHKWVPALHNNTGGWVAIQDEAFYSEPEEHEFAISSFFFRGNAEQIEQSLWDFLQAMYRQAAAKTWRKPVEYMIERFITPAIERYLSSKDWTKVPPVDEAWVSELDPTNQGETK